MICDCKKNNFNVFNNYKPKQTKNEKKICYAFFQLYLFRLTIEKKLSTSKSFL